MPAQFLLELFKKWILQEIKKKKNDLRDEAFDLSKVSDKVYCLKPNSSDYVVLDNEWLEVINSEQAGY